MIYTIAWYEFWFAVKKKSYYLVTFGMPLLVLGYFGLVSLILLAATPGEIKRLSLPTGLIDRSGILTAAGAPLADAMVGEPFTLESQEKPDKELSQELAVDVMEVIESLPGLERKVILYSDVDETYKPLEEETLRGVIEIPADYVRTGKFRVYSQQVDLMNSISGTGWLSNMIGREILKKTDLTEKEIARIRNSATAREFEVGESGVFEKVDYMKKGLSLGIPLGVAGVLILALNMNGSLLLASIAEEKENKVIEVIVSSVSADSLLFGKVLGIAVAGIIQIVIWMAMALAIPVMLMAVSQETIEYDINIIQLLISGVFMITGFLFYGSLLTGMGSLGSTYKDCQQLSIVVMLFACIPMMMWMHFLSDPNGMVPRVLSFIPLFSPVGMTLRLGAGDIPMWEVALSFVILVVSTWFAVKIAARLFRAGTLMQGKSPGVRGIWKALTQS